MTGGAGNVVFGECDRQTWHPDLDWLERELEGPNPPKMVVLVNPNNPTGTFRRQTAHPRVPLPLSFPPAPTVSHHGQRGTLK